MNPTKLGDIIIFARNGIGVFSVLSIITFFVMRSGSRLETYQVGNTGSDTIALKSDYKNQVFKFAFNAKSPQVNSWAYYNIDVLDANKEYEFTFDYEFWEESGYDQGYYWHESETGFKYHVVRKNKGPFYLVVSQSQTSTAVGYDLYISVFKQRGSSVLFLISFILGLIITVALHNLKEEIIKSYGQRKVYHD